MKTISGEEMSSVLEKKGWTLARITGSHHVLTRPGSKLQITVPVHGNRDFKAGLQGAIMKQAEISEEEL